MIKGVHFSFFLFFLPPPPKLRTKPRALLLLGKCSTSELNPQPPLLKIVYFCVYVCVFYQIKQKKAKSKTAANSSLSFKVDDETWMCGHQGPSPQSLTSCTQNRVNIWHPPRWMSRENDLCTEDWLAELSPPSSTSPVRWTVHSRSWTRQQGR